MRKALALVPLALTILTSQDIRADMVPTGENAVKSSIRVEADVPPGQTLLLGHTFRGLDLIEPGKVAPVEWHPMGGLMQIAVVPSSAVANVEELRQKIDRRSLTAIFQQGKTCHEPFAGFRTVPISAKAREIRWNYKVTFVGDVCKATLVAGLQSLNTSPNPSLRPRPKVLADVKSVLAPRTAKWLQSLKNGGLSRRWPWPVWCSFIGVDRIGAQRNDCVDCAHAAALFWRNASLFQFACQTSRFEQTQTIGRHCRYCIGTIGSDEPEAFFLGARHGFLGRMYGNGQRRGSRWRAPSAMRCGMQKTRLCRRQNRAFESIRSRSSQASAFRCVYVFRSSDVSTAGTQSGRVAEGVMVTLSP